MTSLRIAMEKLRENGTILVSIDVTMTVLILFSVEIPPIVRIAASLAYLFYLVGTSISLYKTRKAMGMIENKYYSGLYVLLMLLSIVRYFIVYYTVRKVQNMLRRA